MKMKKTRTCSFAVNTFPQVIVVMPVIYNITECKCRTAMNGNEKEHFPTRLASTVVTNDVC